MSNSTPDRHTLTSRLFDTGVEQRLSGAVVRPADLSAAHRNEMYGLMDAYFLGMQRSRFERDLAEKEAVILLLDRISGSVHGFSTFMRMNEVIESRPVIAFFSGDTIIAREYWGDTLLSRLWSQTVFAEAERIQATSPQTRVYWFLISSGYRTWRFLPIFFRDYYPNPRCSMPLFEQRVFDQLGRAKFGEEFLPTTGIVRFRDPTPLRQGISDVTDERRHDELVAFFERVNPGHVQGDELACLTEISRANLTRAGARMVGGGLHFASDYQANSI